MMKFSAQNLKISTPILVFKFSTSDENDNESVPDSSEKQNSIDLVSTLNSNSLSLQ